MPNLVKKERQNQRMDIHLWMLDPSKLAYERGTQPLSEKCEEPPPLLADVTFSPKEL